MGWITRLLQRNFAPKQLRIARLVTLPGMMDIYILHIETKSWSPLNICRTDYCAPYSQDGVGIVLYKMAQLVPGNEPTTVLINSASVCPWCSHRVRSVFTHFSALLWATRPLWHWRGVLLPPSQSSPIHLCALELV